MIYGRLGFELRFGGSGSRRTEEDSIQHLDVSFYLCSGGSGSRRTEEDSIQHLDVSFNPCFRGSGSRSFICSTYNRAIHRFQSLFSWIWLSKNGERYELIRWHLVSILVFVDLALEGEA